MKGSIETGSTVPKVQWDESGTETFRPDVCNVDSTREEICFLFGLYTAEGDGQSDMTVQKRIIVSPFVAKHLANLLGNVLRDHESMTRCGSCRPKEFSSCADR